MTAQALAGTVAIITGAGSGLGAASARRLAADGAHVVVNDLHEGAAKEVAAEVGGEVAVFDVCDAAAFTAAVDDVVARHGRLDVLVNNAGIAPPPDPERVQLSIANQMARMEGRPGDMQPTRAFSSLTDEAWDRMIRVHQYGTFYGMRAALRHMEQARSGAIVNLSSVLGLYPSAGAPHYSAAKAAIIALTKSAAAEVAPFGVRVNAICPGFIDTPLLGDLDPAMKAMIGLRIGMGRMGRAEDIAEIVRFLAGPESAYCTGDVFPASGGYVG